LYRDHDDLELQLLPTTRQCDLERERIDLGLRLGTGDWPGTASRQLMPERICPVVVAELAEQWRRWGWDQVIRHARPVVNEQHPSEWQQWCAATGRVPSGTTRFTRLDFFDLVLQAGRSPMVNDAVARGDLVAPCAEWVETGRSYYVVWPERRPPNRHARKVLDWMLNSAIEGSGVS